MSKWTCLGWVALGASMFASACSSDESTGTGTLDSCNKACDHVAAKNCGDVVASECQKTCESDGVCPKELNAYFECVANTAVVACSGTTTSVSGCDAQDSAYTDCASCAPTASDGSCGACMKTSCCGELKSYNVAVDSAGFVACIDPCTTQACFDGCVSTFPTAGAAYNAAVACQDKSCTRPCTCGAQTGDQPCTACVKANCCDLFVAYSTTSDIAGFDACITPCTTQACVDACVTSFPTAGAAFNKLVTMCLNTTCATACAG
jgi:hypothetical protein